MKLNLLLIALLLPVDGLAAESPFPAEKSREKANKLSQEGNWKDALALHRELLGKVDDAKSWKDLENALQALRHLLRDAYVADAVVILGSIDVIMGEVDR